eukprot:892869-Amphidinium_carterae.1
MAKLIEASSHDTEVNRHSAFETDGPKAWTLFQVKDGGWLETTMALSHAALHAPELYNNRPKTEGMHTDTFVTCVRPAAVIFKNVIRKLNKCPFTLFELILDRSESKAEELLRLGHCCLDMFSRKFLDCFSSVEGLLSEDAHQILAAVACRMKLTTVSTERLHSTNARTARMRVETHSCHIEHLALQHAAFAGPAFVRAGMTLETNAVQKSKRGRPKKTAIPFGKRHADGENDMAPRKMRRGG